MNRKSNMGYGGAWQVGVKPVPGGRGTMPDHLMEVVGVVVIRWCW